MSKYVPSCKEEVEFLKNYNPKDFPPLAVTVDAVVLGVFKNASDNYRKSGTPQLMVLLVKRNDFPYKGKYALPGGFVHEDETMEETLGRTLKTKTGLTDVFNEQLYTISDVDRDPRMRVISCAYFSLLDIDEAEITDAEWFPVSEAINMDLAFDHATIIKDALERIRGKINYTDIVFNMMPKEFTINDLQQVYEIVLDKKLLGAAFRRTISDSIEDTGKMTSNEGHRPARIFRYKKSSEK